MPVLMVATNQPGNDEAHLTMSNAGSFGFEVCIRKTGFMQKIMPIQDYEEALHVFARYVNVEDLKII